MEVRKIRPRCNFSRVLEEVVTSCSPAVEIRELLSNAVDAGATWIRLAPILGTLSGYVLADNGSGMGHGREGEATSLDAFFSIGFSTRASDPGKIGRKGQGAKPFCSAEHSLIVLTKEPEDELYTVVRLDRPAFTYMKQDQPDIQAEQMAQEDVESFLMGELHYSNQGLSPAINPRNEHSRARVHVHIRHHVVQPFLKFKSGTLLVALGVQESMRDLLGNCDEFDGYAPLENKLRPTLTTEHNLKLPAYLRFKTVFGHPLLARDLRDAGVGEDTLRDESEHLLGEDSQLARMDCGVLTRGPDSARALDQFQVRSIPVGFRYIPFGAAAGQRKRLGREQPGAKSSKSTRNNHPATAKDFSQASFSQRFVTSFKHLAEQYVLVLDVTGKGDRNNSWPSLSRQGATRSGIKVSEFNGVLMYASGIYVCVIKDMLQSQVLEPYKELEASPFINQWDIKLVGDFELKTDRCSYSEGTAKLLNNKEFLEKFRAALDKFMAEGNEDNLFADLVKRAKLQHHSAAGDEERKATEEILQKMAREQERLRVPLPCGNYQDLYQPASGDENSLILMYGAFRANLPDRLFGEREDLLNLQQFWPHIHRVKGGEGEDAYGVDMAERQYLDFTDMQPFDAKLIETMEFKKTFRIPDQSGEGSKVPSTSFNHQWLLTDYLIAWNFLWDDEHLTTCNDQIIIEEGKKLWDKRGNYGLMSEAAAYDGKTLSIPECMKGYAFYVKNRRNYQGGPVSPPSSRRKREFTLVVCFKMLLEVTFRPYQIPGRAVPGLVWSPPNSRPGFVAENVQGSGMASQAVRSSRSRTQACRASGQGTRTCRKRQSYVENASDSEAEYVPRRRAIGGGRCAGQTRGRGRSNV